MARDFRAADGRPWTPAEARGLSDTIDAILCEEAWWEAARAGKAAFRRVVWADRPARCAEGSEIGGSPCPAREGILLDVPE